MRACLHVRYAYTTPLFLPPCVCVCVSTVYCEEEAEGETGSHGDTQRAEVHAPATDTQPAATTCLETVEIAPGLKIRQVRGDTYTHTHTSHAQVY